MRASILPMVSSIIALVLVSSIRIVLPHGSTSETNALPVGVTHSVQLDCLGLQPLNEWLHQVPNGGLNLCDVSRCIKLPHPLRFGGGDGLVAFSDARKEALACLLNPVTFKGKRQRGLAGQPPGLAHPLGNDKKQRQVRPGLA